ncbi:MAG: riboflavin synthase [Hyphomicrobium sp.]
MFTGIITGIGEVALREGGQFTVRAPYAANSIAIGASIACDGCCLTVTRVSPDGKGCHFAVDVSNETLSKTTLGSWQPGRNINLERALKAGDELGGHIVSGHIDGLGRVVRMADDGSSRSFELVVPETLAKFIAPKGSVTLNGTSLTVNEVKGCGFAINLIPHTLTVTTWGRTKPGDDVNLEVDLFARHAARLMEFKT